MVVSSLVISKVTSFFFDFIQILAFDKHMNVILSDCEEIRKIKPKAGKKLVNEEEKRTLGLILLRGDKIISISIDGNPQKEDDSRVPKAGGAGGPGQAKPAARTLPPVVGAPPAGLQGQVGGHGVPQMGGFGGPPPRPF